MFGTYPYSYITAVKIFKSYYQLSTIQAIRALNRMLKDYKTWKKHRTSFNQYDKIGVGMILTKMQIEVEKGNHYE